jgi:hypothetical protein
MQRDRAKKEATAGPSTAFGEKEAPNFAQDDSLLLPGIV